MTVLVERCCGAAELALRLGRAEDAVALCRHVLAQYRWHLRAHLLLGQAYLEQGEEEEAGRAFRLVLAVDPESAEAYGGLGILFLQQGDLDSAVRTFARAFENAPESDEIRGALQQALSQQAGRPVPPPAFTAACLGRFYLRRGVPQPAAEAYAAAFRDDSSREDRRLAYATALWQAGARQQALELCSPLLEQRPHPLVALLLAAAARFQQHDTAAGRRLWGEARAWDPDDLRAGLLFGEFPELPSPPEPAEIAAALPEPLLELVEMTDQLVVEVPPRSDQAANELAAYARGLASASPKGNEPIDPSLRRFQEAVERIHGRLYGTEPSTAAARSARGAKDRRPAAVLLAWEEGLQARFGQEGAVQIDRVLQELARAAETQRVSSRVIYLDRPPYAELPRPDPRAPEQIKSFLDELDRRLTEEGLDFHYLLLIGGADLLPFARLPNPAEDGDENVPSDNLYASRDPTYLIPERAVGRLPDDGSGRAAPFVRQLERCVARLRGENQPLTPTGCLGVVLPWMRVFMPWSAGEPKVQRRFGLSAAVWAQASEQVLNVLPGQDPLRLCPPTCREALSPGWLAGVPMAYFNLHGAAESPHWYGQRDISQSGEGPLMPIAFSPDRIPTGQVEDIVVYSEACYGAHILGQDADSSIALRFLAEGALGVVGSTVISYGVSSPPLMDADLLGEYFWRHLLRGRNLGDALLHAKIDFTQEMYRRQGYLDGDDMKTLIQFVLYGDPLAAVGLSPMAAETRAVVEQVDVPPMLCKQHEKALALHHLSGDLVQRVRRSLAWLQQGEEVTDLDVVLRSACPGGICSGRCQEAQGKAVQAGGPEALVFTARREVRTEDGTCIPQLARVVVDPKGHITKMAVTK